MQLHGMNGTEACRDMNISSKLFSKWKKVIKSQMTAKKDNIKAEAFTMEETLAYWNTRKSY